MSPSPGDPQQSPGAGTTRGAAWLLVASLLAVFVIAMLGYVKVTMARSVLGAPSVEVSLEAYVRSGILMLATTLATLPATCADFLGRPSWWFRTGLPGTGLYLVILAWSLPRFPLRRRIHDMAGADADASVSVAVAFVLLLVAARLCFDGQSALWIQGLLTGPPAASSPAAVERLEAIVLAGDAGALTRRYVGFLLGWLASAHLVQRFFRRLEWSPETPDHRAVGRAAAGLAAGLLALSLACAPAYYALVQVSSGYPSVRVVSTRDDRPPVDGLLVERAASWITVYDTETRRLRLLATSEVREIQPGAMRRLFPLKPPSGGPGR